jgi:hypothetical protein
MAYSGLSGWVDETVGWIHQVQARVQWWYLVGAITDDKFHEQLNNCSRLKDASAQRSAQNRQRTIPTERPPLIGEVSANFSGYRVSHGQRNESPRPLISVF